MTYRTINIAILFICYALVGCGRLHGEKIYYKSVDQSSGMTLIAGTHKVRVGAEGWDFYISVKSTHGGEIARSTITSIDTPDDVGTGSLEIIGLSLDMQKQKVRLSFKNGKSLSVPVVLWIDQNL